MILCVCKLVNLVGLVWLVCLPLGPGFWAVGLVWRSGVYLDEWKVASVNVDLHFPVLSLFAALFSLLLLSLQGRLIFGW